LVTLPVAALAIVALVSGSQPIGWAALAVALVLGVAVALGGASIGGRILDSSGAAMLARLRLIRG
jgi:hypothetical protein